MNRPRYDTGQGRPSFGPASPFQVGPRRRCPDPLPQSLSGSPSSPSSAMGAHGQAMSPTIHGRSEGARVRLRYHPEAHPLDVHRRNLRHRKAGFFAHPGPAQQVVCPRKVLTPDGAVRCGLGPRLQWASVRCTKGFTNSFREICVTVPLVRARHRGEGTPDDRARKPHGAAASAGR
jgi:hypothetical protein